MPPVNVGLLDGKLASRQHDRRLIAKCPRSNKDVLCVLKLLLLSIALASLTKMEGASPQGWVGTWAASQQVPEPQNALPSADLTDLTLRETVHVSLGGSNIRVRLCIRHASTPSYFGALGATGRIWFQFIDPASDHVLLFNGSADVIIPPAAEYVSDSIAYPLAPLSELTVSMHLEADPGQQTGHPGSRQTTFYTHGDLTAVADMPSAKKVEHWDVLSGVDVQASSDSYSIVALGDSITDGHATTTNGNDRWTDVLAQRLQANADTPGAGVLNQGVGGNHL